MELLLAGVQHIEKHIEGQEVVDGADRSDKDHKVADQPNVPMLGRAHIGIVHIVGGNGDLRHVIEKIVQQNLRGKHGKKWKKQRSSRHAEHVAEIGTGPNQQVLHDVAKGPSAFENSVV